jgi:hypothetical protein
LEREACKNPAFFLHIFEEDTMIYKGFIIFITSYGWRIKGTGIITATQEEAMEIIDGRIL